MRRMKLILAAAIILSPFAATADPIEIEVGLADILGDQYLVSLIADDNGDFDAQSFNDLAPTITFTTLDDAFAAGAALIAAFGGDFDWSPFISGVFNGALDYPLGGRIAYSVGLNEYSYVTINDLDPGDLLGPFTTDLNVGNYFSFIQFEAVRVSEPGALALLGLGLAGMGLGRRRKKT